MKGYAKGYISDKTKEAMKGAVNRSDSFYFNNYTHTYLIREKKIFLWFFTKELCRYDTDAMQKDAAKNNCYLMNYYDSTPRFHQDSDIERYKKILQLSEAEVFYLDDELQAALNRFNQGATER